MITEAQAITEIAKGYVNKGLRLCDVVIFCTADPTYEAGVKPLTAGDYIKWLLIPGNASGPMNNNSLIAAFLAYVRIPGNPEYEQALR
jgi:hypothetical protein